MRLRDEKRRKKNGQLVSLDEVVLVVYETRDHVGLRHDKAQRGVTGKLGHVPQREREHHLPCHLDDGPACETGKKVQHTL